MEMEELFMLLFSAFIVLIIMKVTAAVLKKNNDAEDNAQPVRTEQAKLVDMQQIPPVGQIVLGEIWTLFELESGERVRLNAQVQNTLVIGDQGLLTWQGRKILKFERNIIR